MVVTHHSGRRQVLQADADPGRRPTEWPGLTDAIRRTMRANKSKNTKPEVAVRSLLHRAGYSFLTHVRSLPGTPDIAFTARRKVVCVHGCFWHAHLGCRFATVPKTRREFWAAKLIRNQERDATHAMRLADMGWETHVVWECEIRDAATLLRRLKGFLGPPRRRVPVVRTSPSMRP